MLGMVQQILVDEGKVLLTHKLFDIKVLDCMKSIHFNVAAVNELKIHWCYLENLCSESACLL